METKLIEAIAARSARIGVIGLGYVGLPLALLFAKKGYTVTGFDIDHAKVASLNHGKLYIERLSHDDLLAALADGTFNATTDMTQLGSQDVVIVCVPTPLNRHREPDLSYVVKTTHTVARALPAKHLQLVVLESTTYPGTTREVVKPILDAAEAPYLLAYSPEREDPGNAFFDTATTPKLVAGLTPDALTAAVALYGRVINRVEAVRTPEVAEAAKLTENVFRAVNIALVNELKVIYERMGIDIWEVLDAAATKPFGFMRFDPGPGLGGHCIPLDPFYLSWKAREYGMNTRFIELAGEINRAMPEYVVAQLRAGLNRQRKTMSNASLLILGAAYKPDVSDTRESPAFEIMRLVMQDGAFISYYDPFVPELVPTRNQPWLPKLCSVDLNEDVVRTVDAVVLVTNHDAVDYAMIRKHAKLIVDTRGVFPAEAGNVIQA